jgi:hypothetical protein
MTGFLTRLIDRHLNPGGKVSPEVRGRFEPGRSVALLNRGSQPFSGIETDVEFNDKRPATEEKPGQQRERPVQRDSPITNEKANPLVQSKKTGFKQVLKETEKNKTTDVHEISTTTEPLLEPGKKSVETGKKGISARKEKPEREVESEQNFENKPLLQKNQRNNEREKPGSQDFQKPLAQGSSIIKVTKKNIVQPLFFDPGMTFPPTRLKKKDNFSENSKGILHPSAWSAKQNAGLARDTILKETRTPSTPAIKVNIGRIEVRAVMQQAPSPPQPTESPKPRLSLEDYLNNRNQVKK